MHNFEFVMLLLTFLHFVLSYSLTKAQLRSVQGEPWRISATNVIDTKCSDYVTGTSVNDSYEWTGDYAFDTVRTNHLRVPVTIKWRNVGRLQLTCTVTGVNPDLSAVAVFDVRLEPLSIRSRQDDSYVNDNVYLLIIVGIIATMSVLGCTGLMVRKIKQTAKSTDRKLNFLAKSIAALTGTAGPSRQHSKRGQSYHVDTPDHHGESSYLKERTNSNDQSRKET